LTSKDREVPEYRNSCGNHYQESRNKMLRSGLQFVKFGEVYFALATYLRETTLVVGTPTRPWLDECWLT